MGKVLIIKLILFLTILSGSLYAQPFLRYTKSEIVEKKGYDYTVNPLESGGYSLTYSNQNSITMYFFTNDAICIMSSYGTTQASKLNAMVEEYNRTAVIIDNFNWRYYTGDGQVLYISLRKISDIPTFFYGHVPVVDE